MKKDEAMKALYLIQSKLKLKEFAGDPIIDNIINAIEVLQNKESKFDNLADIISDYQHSFNCDNPLEEAYRQKLLEDIKKFKLY